MSLIERLASQKIEERLIKWVANIESYYGVAKIRGVKDVLRDL